MQAIKRNIRHEQGYTLAGMISAWEHMATLHNEAYGDFIGEDYVLGEPWRDIGLAIIELLNGETGRLDCGTIDREVRECLRDNGFTEDSGL